jgi:DNA polymerase III alpha subunit
MRTAGAKIRGVRANRSRGRCWYDKDRDDVVLGYLSIKGIGVKAAAELERLRNTTSLEEWNELADRRVLNKKVREFLIRHDVFNCWSRDRNELSSKLLGPSPSRRGPHISKIYEDAGQQRLFP